MYLYKVLEKGRSGVNNTRYVISKIKNLSMNNLESCIANRLYKDTNCAFKTTDSTSIIYRAPKSGVSLLLKRGRNSRYTGPLYSLYFLKGDVQTIKALCKDASNVLDLGPITTKCPTQLEPHRFHKGSSSFTETKNNVDVRTNGSNTSYGTGDNNIQPSVSNARLSKFLAERDSMSKLFSYK